MMSDAIAWHSEIAADFDAKYLNSAAFKERLSVWGQLMAAHITPQSRVLDAGCGSGVMAQLASARALSVHGFDGSAEMVALAKARKARGQMANTEFEQGTLESSGWLESGGYDVILCSSVLEYVEDWMAAFSHLAAALNPQGVIIFSMPNGASLYRKAERLAFALTGRPAYYAHVRHVPTAREVDKLLGRSGFAVVSRDYYAKVPFLSPLARRLKQPQITDNLFVTTCRRPD